LQEKEKLSSKNKAGKMLNLHIAAWAGVGLLVAVAWWIYALAWAPTPITMTAPIVWTLVRFSCPVVMVGTYLHVGVSLFWVLVTNTATYALIGLIVESLRWRLDPAN
jgi:hypothetical protein